MVVSTRKQIKPKKPYPSFPLTAHNNGQWCKKIRGKIHFFGVWDDPQAALNSYLQVAEDLHAGRSPQKGTLLSGEITVKDICNEYLTYQMHKAETGDISSRWFEDCRRAVTCFARSVGSNRLVEDLGPEDFQRFRSHLVRRGLKTKGSGLGVYALNRNITIIKGIFKYSYEVGYIKHPIRYGKSFDKPKASIIRKNRQATELANGKRLFAVSEMRSLLDACGNPLRAMILLGINGGFGNTDCARLPLAAVDWNQAIIEFYRPKTGIERMVLLWSETLDALRETLAKRPKPADEDSGKLVFLTAFGCPWVRDVRGKLFGG